MAIYPYASWLMGTFFVASFVNLLVTYVLLLFQPMMLSFTSVKTMGIAISSAPAPW